MEKTQNTVIFHETAVYVRNEAPFIIIHFAHLVSLSLRQFIQLISFPPQLSSTIMVVEYRY